MVKAKNKMSKAKVGRGVLLSMLILFISSGSYTFSGSLRPEIRLKNRKSLFVAVGSGVLFGVKPADIKRINKEVLQAGIIKEPSLEIMQSGVFSINKMALYLHSNNPHISMSKSHEIASLYIDEANKEGINYDVAFSQMCLETGFLRFGGDVEPGQNNFCGLGVTGGGAKGLSFEDERKGIRAHIQHLKAYASTDKLNTELVDERFRFVKRGSAKKVDELTGKWASDKDYGEKIDNIIKRMSDFNP